MRRSGTQGKGTPAKPKKKLPGFSAAPPKQAAKRTPAQQVGANVIKAGQRTKPYPKRPGLGATPAKPTAKPSKSLRGLQRDTYKSLDLKTRKALSRPAKGTYDLTKTKPQPDTDISGGIHAERMRAQRAMRAASKWKPSDGKPTAQQVKGAKVALKLERKRQTKAALGTIAATGKRASSTRLNHVSGGADKTTSTALLRMVPGVGQALASNKTAVNLTTAAVRVPKNVAEVVAEDPKKQGKKLVGDTVKSIPSSVAGVVGLATNPKEGVKGIAADYKRRYGDLLQGNEEKFKQRMKKEGVLPEVLDSTIALGSATAGAGRLLQKAGEAAARGGSTSRFARIAAAERPKLRVAAGTSTRAVRQQEKHANFFRNAARAAVDSKRAKKTAKEARKPDASPEVRAAAASGGKEVVPLRKSTTKRAQRKLIAAEKGAATYRLKATQQRAQRESATTIGKATKAKGKAKVSRGEKKLRNAALFYAQQLGIHSPEAAREHLGKRLDAIAAERSKMSVDDELRAAMAEGDRLTERFNDYRDTARVPDELWNAMEENAALQQRLGRKAGAKKIASREDEVPTIKALLADPERYFTPQVAEGAKTQRVFAARSAAHDPGLGETPADRAEASLVRAFKPQAEHLGIERAPGEAASQWITRVAQAAKHAGLEQPGYVPSWKRDPLGRNSARAAGGTRFTARDRNYRGLNFAAGTQQLRPENLTLQAMKNIKRGENWRLVDRHIENAAIDSLPDRATGKPIDFKSGTPAQIADKLEQAGVDPNTVVVVNVGRVKEELARGMKRQADDEYAARVGGHDVTDPRHADPAAELDGALKAGLAAVGDPKYAGDSGGFRVFSKEAWNQIEADAKPSGKYARSWDVMKGKVSRVLLGNPAWASIQTAANATQAFIGGTGPITFAQAHRLWRKIDPDVRLKAEAEAGIHKWFDPQQHLGSSVHNNVVDDWRALKETPTYQKIHKANPLDLIFRYDTAETNAFRRAMFTKQLKREAYQAMSRDIGELATLQRRIMDALTLQQPEARMLKLMEDPEVVTRAAQYVDDWLGNFTRYTAAERRVIGRATMFYGFLRFSVKLAFYTLPVKHPLRAAILLQLGRLTKDELEAIFGTDVPPYEYGNYYSSDGKTRLPTNRMSAFANAIQYETPRDLARVAPSFVQVVMNQIAQQDSFGKPWRINGSTKQVDANNAVPLLDADRLQIALEDFSRLNPGYRLAEKVGLNPITGAAAGASFGLPGVALGALLGVVHPQKPLRGKQGADSSLFKPQPTRYKNDEEGIPTLASLLGTKRESGYDSNQRRIARQNKEAKSAYADYFYPFGLPGLQPASGKSRIEEAKRYAAYQQQKKGKKDDGIPTLAKLLKSK